VPPYRGRISLRRHALRSRGCESEGARKNAGHMTTPPLRISRSSRVFVLTGAGISAESGIRTFRDAGGLWGQYRFEEVASPSSRSGAAAPYTPPPASSTRHEVARTPYTWGPSGRTTRAPSTSSGSVERGTSSRRSSTRSRRRRFRSQSARWFRQDRETWSSSVTAAGVGEIRSLRGRLLEASDQTVSNLGPVVRNDRKQH